MPSLFFIQALHLLAAVLLTVFVEFLSVFPFYKNLVSEQFLFVIVLRFVFFYVLGIPFVFLYKKYFKNKLTFEFKEDERQLETIAVLLGLVNEKDPNVEHHCKRVAQIVRTFCGALQLKSEDSRVIVFAAMFHDIGKTFLDGKHLSRPFSELSEEEKAQYRKHPLLGKRILDKIKGYPGANVIVQYHHEHWDGKGFPEGLSGENIPLGSRIISIVEAYDGYTHGLNFEESVKKEIAIRRIQELRGTRFDPGLVDVFIEMLTKQVKS